ncbi:heterokaryon incompatibility protein-domain-containing protein, partial [Immersiella caudata]
MARWHGAYCRVPDVAVDAGVPSCQSCGECWDLESFVAQQRNANPFPQIPPNENPGDLDLFWPPTVPYAREIEIHCLPQEEDTAPEPPRIYNRELGPEDFRLLCLQGSADSSSPIRADLENYAFERCPEYEAVSYAWGGEDNDVSPCQPLFLGPYWDPLPLTNNCWSMLQALRPTRGMRMLWVDAICINQDNAEERAEQVARMAFIYRDCRRVISYLGPDLVASPSISSGFPRRQRLEDSVTMADDELFIGGKVNFLKLIQRRYFTRVWIIQELVLPRQVSIPVGDIELCADQQTARNLPELFWESVGVPWIGFLAQGGVEGAEIFDILLITADSHSTDPRDRVFGVLALLPTSRGGHQGPLRPNYSISPLHVSIGISAHCLLALKRTEMLFAAAGLNGYPTWAPDWKVRNQGLALRSEMAAEEKEERRVESTSINWSSTVRKRPPSAQWKSSAFGNRRTRLALTTAWDHEACVDGKTGALSINLVHILQFPTAPELVGTGGEGGQVFSVQPRSVPFCGVADREKAVHLWLTSTGPLHETVDPKTDHLFLLDEGDKAPLYLVLREDQDGTTDENTFKLIGCCEYLCF